mgnify:CR=1 FL=1
MKKSQKSTEITPLETALQKQFKPDASRLDTLIREAYDRTTKIQGANIAAMVGFGLLALSVKPIIGHGKFGDWLKGVLGGQMSKSTAYSWIEAAKYLIAKISTAEKQTDIISVRICEFIAAVNIKNGAEEIFSDAKLTSDFVAHVSANLPFKTFLHILKTANAAAIEAEDEERRSIESSKKAVGLRGLQGGCGEQSPQMMLWEDWTNELGDIDKLVKHKDKLRLSNDQYKMIAQKLRATADEIESLIKA